jgi:hypothetical protein
MDRPVRVCKLGQFAIFFWEDERRVGIKFRIGFDWGIELLCLKYFVTKTLRTALRWSFHATASPAMFSTFSQ